MRCEQIREWISDELDGCLDPRNKPLLAEHLAACADCRRELDELRQTVTLLRQAEPVAPPAGMVTAVRQRLQKKPQNAVWRMLGLPQTRVAIAAGLVLIVGVYGWREMTAPREVDGRGPGAGGRGRVGQDREAVAASVADDSVGRPAARRPSPKTKEYGDTAAYEPMPAATKPQPARAPSVAIETAPLLEETGEVHAKRADGFAAGEALKKSPLPSARRDTSESNGGIWRSEQKDQPDAMRGPAADKAEQEQVAIPLAADRQVLSAAAPAKALAGDALKREDKDGADARAAGKADAYAGQASDTLQSVEVPGSVRETPAAAPAKTRASKAATGRLELNGSPGFKDMKAESLRFQSSNVRRQDITVISKDTGRVMELIGRYTDQVDRKTVPPKPAAGGKGVARDVVPADSGPLTRTVRISAAAYPEFLRQLESIGKLMTPDEEKKRLESSAELDQEVRRTPVDEDQGFVLLQITIVPEGKSTPSALRK